MQSSQFPPASRRSKPSPRRTASLKSLRALDQCRRADRHHLQADAAGRPGHPHWPARGGGRCKCAARVSPGERKPAADRLRGDWRVDGGRLADAADERRAWRDGARRLPPKRRKSGLTLNQPRKRRLRCSTSGGHRSLPSFSLVGAATLACASRARRRPQPVCHPFLGHHGDRRTATDRPDRQPFVPKATQHLLSVRTVLKWFSAAMR